MKKNILHTESSTGFGGQEIRILKEAQGMRERGHEIIFAIVEGGKLALEARLLGFRVYELPFKKAKALSTLLRLIWIINRHKIDLVNTHSSWDAWIGGIAARICFKKVIRTRHLSTMIRKGLNSIVLYKFLADYVATTSSSIIPIIQKQAHLSPSRIRCVPTGVDPKEILYKSEDVEAFRQKYKIQQTDILVGTVCVLRSWKGITDLLDAAQLLRDHDRIKWVIVGGGHIQDYLPKRDALNLQDRVIFTGHIAPPYAAIAALDIFTLLSTAHEGISQASLQASYLEKPLITTPIGGLSEVCLDKKTGLIVPPKSPSAIAQAVLELADAPDLCKIYGQNGKAHVLKNFMLEQTLNQMEEIARFL